MREDDILYILSLDRLGRNYDEIKKEWEELAQVIKCDIVVIDIALKEKRPYGRPKQEIDKSFVDVYLKWKDGEITAKSK